MASITTILGTDSLASSRVVLNDNFSSLNDEIVEIGTLLNVATQTLTLSGDINAKQLNLKNGGVNLFTVNTSDVISHLPLTVESSITLEAGLKKSVSGIVSAMPGVNAYAKTTYILSATALTGVNIVSAGDEGQEVTFIASGGDVVIDGNGITGTAFNLTIAQNGTLTLRYSNGTWYIISYFNVTFPTA
jgi:hypothetical protein